MKPNAVPTPYSAFGAVASSSTTPTTTTSSPPPATSATLAGVVDVDEHRRDASDEAEAEALMARLSLRATRTEPPAAHSPSFRHVLVDTVAGLAEAVSALQGASRVALDSEGVDLSRVGPLTLLSLKRLGDGRDGDGADHAGARPVFLIDVLALDGRRVFSSDSALRRLIECREIVKVTFDCRSDSDALWHQFGVRLDNVLDLQVYDQGVRIHRGEPSPRLNGTRVPYVTGMAKVAPRYVSRARLRELDAPAPHKADARAWQRRPLSGSAQAYAANDVHLIELMLHEMDAARVPQRIMDRVRAHSQRYVDAFRAHRDVVKWETHKRLVMEEVSIWSEA